MSFDGAFLDLEFEGLLKSDLNGVLDWLLKGAGHKYLRRIPTGDLKRPYRYVYSVDSIHHGSNPVVGEKVRVNDEGKEGHYEVTHVHDDGHVTVKHDETGKELKLHKDNLHDQFKAQHAWKIQESRSKLMRVAVEADKYGTDAQKKRALDAIHAFDDRYGFKRFELTPKPVVESKAPPKERVPRTPVQRGPVEPPKILETMMGSAGRQRKFAQLQEARRAEGAASKQQAESVGAHIAGSAKDRADYRRLLETGKINIRDVPLEVAASFASRDKHMVDVSPDTLRAQGVEPPAAYIAAAVVAATAAKPPKDALALHPDAPLLFAEGWRELNRTISEAKTREQWGQALQDIQDAVKNAGHVDTDGMNDPRVKAARTAIMDRGYKPWSEVERDREELVGAVAAALGRPVTEFALGGGGAVVDVKARQRVHAKYLSMGKPFAKLSLRRLTSSSFLT